MLAETVQSMMTHRHFIQDKEQISSSIKRLASEMTQDGASRSTVLKQLISMVHLPSAKNIMENNVVSDVATGSSGHVTIVLPS